MTLWEFVVALDGYATANGADEKKPPAMSVDRLRQLGIVGLEDA